MRKYAKRYRASLTDLCTSTVVQAGYFVVLLQDNWVRPSVMFHQPLNPHIANIMLVGVTLMIDSI